MKVGIFTRRMAISRRFVHTHLLLPPLKHWRMWLFDRVLLASTTDLSPNRILIGVSEMLILFIYS